jgi:hypothetical protein
LVQLAGRYGCEVQAVRYEWGGHLADDLAAALRDASDVGPSS